MYFTNTKQRLVSSSRAISNEADWDHDVINVTFVVISVKLRIGKDVTMTYSPE